MTSNSPELYHLLTEMATLIEQNSEPDPQLYILFFQQPELAFKLLDIINNLEEQLDEGLSVYSACVFALDICVAQLQGAAESNKLSAKILTQLMNHLAELINSQKHTLSFWLPVLNSFYEAHVELTDELKNAYYDLASEEEEFINDGEPVSHLDAIRDLIEELSDLSVFDIAENFFAQSYAMPADFFADLMLDLYNIEQGADIALLILLHPKAEVREVALATMGQIMDFVTLSSISLSRLQAIKYWYPEREQAIFNSWIKIQRKKGVVFASEPEKNANVAIRATEVDGSGSQGIFLHLRKHRRNRLCGMLLKYELGLKDAWITPEISSKDVKDYYKQAFDESVTLREVDLSYFTMIVEHFLAIAIERGEIPNVYFLEIQELLGIRLRPQKLDLDYLLEQLGIQITPFTQDTIKESLQRSKSWLKSKSFTESWYLENPIIDKIVNHNSSFIDGIRVCRMKEAMAAVFTEEMEQNRSKWQFHFLWVALWMKAKEKRNEKIWRDSFLIAYSIHEGVPLNEIPVMNEICRQTVINSVETMQERRTHLNQE